MTQALNAYIQDAAGQSKYILLSNFDDKFPSILKMKQQNSFFALRWINSSFREVPKKLKKHEKLLYWKLWTSESITKE